MGAVSASQQNSYFKENFMIKNICNYSAIILLSLVVMTSAVSANPHNGPVKIENRDSNFYSRFLTAKNPQSYGIEVKDGQVTSVKIRSNEGVSIKIYMPDGEVKEYKNEKQYNLEFHAAGEYVIQLKAPGIAKYTLQTLSK
jgi:hypothetical protein